MTDVKCSGCQTEYNLPFTPSPDRYPFFCAECLIKKNDMQKSDYFKGLVVLLSDQLHLGRGSKIYGVRKRNGLTYDLLLERDKETLLLCTTSWEPKPPVKIYPSIPKKNPGQSRVMAFVEINNIDSTVDGIIKTYVKRNGIEAQVPLNSPIK